jgi:hypothetical protein
MEPAAEVTLVAGVAAAVPARCRPILVPLAVAAFVPTGTAVTEDVFVLTGTAVTEAAVVSEEGAPPPARGRTVLTPAPAAAIATSG